MTEVVPPPLPKMIYLIGIIDGESKKIQDKGVEGPNQKVQD